MAGVNVGLRLRFVILQRDSFTCQYCGAKAPDVVLNVDHIHPVSKGGDRNPLNLVTACYDCNQGKKANLLSAELVAMVVARISGYAMPEATPKLTRPKVARITRRHVARPPKHEQIVLRSNIGKTYKVDEIPVGSGFTYVGPDEFLDRFICESCGMLNVHDNERCGCESRAAARQYESHFHCAVCGRTITELEHLDYDGECEDCYSDDERCQFCGTLVDGWDNLEELPVCPDCAAGIEEQA